MAGDERDPMHCRDLPRPVQLKELYKHWRTIRIGHFELENGAFDDYHRFLWAEKKMHVIGIVTFYLCIIFVGRSANCKIFIFVVNAVP